jgi:lipopolysaccharide export system protein LptA
MYKEISVRIFHYKVFSLALPLLIAITLTIAAFSVVSAADTKKKKPSKIHITSDELVAFTNDKFIEFIGNVKATQDTGVLTADKMRIFYRDKKDQKKDEEPVDKIVATGNIRFEFDNNVALSEKAIYTTKDATLVMTGENSKLIKGENYITGNKFILQRVQGKFIVKSDSKKQVEALINPEDKSLNMKKPK